MIGGSTEARSAVAALFQSAPAVLVEVRFPACGTSSEWYFCEVEEQFDKILDRLGHGAELHVSNVLDLKNSKGAACFRKEKEDVQRE
jgi:hypothetical protein